MSRRSLVIMLKEPRPGRVKTRLARDMGTIPATWWFRHQSRRLIRRMSGDLRWQTFAAVSPDLAIHSRFWPSHLPRLPQGAGDLGQRMAGVFHTMPPGPVLIIGADIPGINPDHIEAAFRALGRHDAVFGPAPDGGYWLVGLKRSTAPIAKSAFKDVRWSTEHALSDTIRSLGPGKRIAKISTLRDIDTLEDLIA